jgi:PKD repeat protein
VAIASAILQSGTAPLTVSFDGGGSYDPDGSITGYAWDFGDGSGSSSLMSPSHTYSAAGTYIAQLTVTDNASATATANVTIVVASAGGFVHVESQTVTSVLGGGGKTTGQDLVLIHDAVDQPVAGAVVYATYTGPNSGTLSGTTGVSGEVTLISSWVRNPSVDWCFEVTNVVASGYTFDAMTGSPGVTCESTSPKKQTMFPASCILHENFPNPFYTSTNISFSIPDNEHVLLVVTDILGREVTRLSEGTVTAGKHTITFSASNLPAGLYHCRLETVQGIQIRSMLLMK